MLRSEAMAVQEQLQPEGFKCNSLELHESGTWIATYLNPDADPPEVVIERWHDVYTEGDPEPETETEAEEETEESVASTDSTVSTDARDE